MSAKIEDVVRDINEQAEQLRAIASKNGRPALAALLIAISNSECQQLLAKKYVDGHGFRGVQVTLIDPQRYQVIFEFTRATDKLTILDPTFSVEVRLPNYDVTEIHNPFRELIMQGERTPSDRPFTLAVASGHHEVFATENQLQASTAREEAFHKTLNLGVTASARGTSENTHYDTPYSTAETTYTRTPIDTLHGTAEWSGTPRTPDATITDHMSGDTQGDTGVETRNDHSSESRLDYQDA
jgi:hypothetical protein